MRRSCSTISRTARPRCCRGCRRSPGRPVPAVERGRARRRRAALRVPRPSDRRRRALRGAQGRRRVGGAAARVLRRERGRRDRARRGDGRGRRRDARASAPRRPCTGSRTICRSPRTRRCGRSSVYGRTKRVVEDFLRDLARANANWRIAILRYFNPAGAHDSGMLGEAPRGRPANLVPLLCRIASGELADLSIYGGDWPTPDGTGIRDYLHVQDLAEGHVAALRYLAKAHGALTVNLGAGRGYSVLEVVAAFEKACGRRITKTMAGAACRATSRRTTPIPRARRSSWTGARRAISTRSAPTRGAGRRTAADTRRGGSGFSLTGRRVRLKPDLRLRHATFSASTRISSVSCALSAENSGVVLIV